MRPVKYMTVSLLCVFWVLTSCRGKSGVTVVTNSTLLSITVLPPNATVALGRPLQYTAVANYSDGSSKPLVGATWSTSDAKWAMVTSSGLVIGEKQGPLTVSATYGKIAGSATLTVGPPVSLADELPSRCPTPSKAVQATCREITYEDLPDGARSLLRKLKCDAGPGTSYDSGIAVDLNDDGSPEYQVCCYMPGHGDCGAVLIGKVGTEWRDLTAKQGAMPGGWCGSLVPLETQHRGFHDICFPNVCSPPFKTGTCNQTVWRYDGTGYQPAETDMPDSSSK